MGTKTLSLEACTDPIRQREAAELVSRSYDTVRRWRRMGVLKSYKDAAGGIYLSRSEVLSVAGAQATAHPGSPLQPARTGGQPVTAQGGAQGGATTPAQGWSIALESMQAHLASLEAQLADCQRDRDYLRDRVETLEAQLGRKDERLAALEGADGEIRGLLSERVAVFGLVEEQEKRIVQLEQELKGRGLRETLRSRFRL